MKLLYTLALVVMLFTSCSRPQIEKEEAEWLQINIVDQAGPLKCNGHQYLMLRWTVMRKDAPSLSQSQLIHDPDCPCRQRQKQNDTTTTKNNL